MADGIVSTKNDVYAFGMTVVETIGSILISKPPREHPLDGWVSIYLDARIFTYIIRNAFI